MKNIDINIDIDMVIFENIDIDIDIDKAILKNIDIDIDIDIFQKCRYIDNRYVISIYRTGLPLTDWLLSKMLRECMDWMDTPSRLL